MVAYIRLRLFGFTWDDEGWSSHVSMVARDHGVKGDRHVHCKKKSGAERAAVEVVWLPMERASVRASWAWASEATHSLQKA